MSDEILKPETATEVPAEVKPETAPAPEVTAAPAAAAKVKPNFGTKEFRVWLLKVLKKGGMDAYDIIILAEKQLKSKMNEADLAPDKAGKRSHKWMHRLHDARKSLVDAGLMHPLKHFPTRGNWWQLTPEGLKHKES